MGKGRKEKSIKAIRECLAGVLAIALALFAISFIPAAYLLIFIGLIIYMFIVFAIGLNEIFRYKRKQHNIKEKYFRNKKTIEKMIKEKDSLDGDEGKGEIDRLRQEINDLRSDAEEKEWGYGERIEKTAKEILVQSVAVLAVIMVMFFMDCEAKDVAFAALGEGISHIVNHLDAPQAPVETFHEAIDLSNDRAEIDSRAELFSDRLEQDSVSYEPLSKGNYTYWKYLIKNVEENDPELALEGRKILSFAGDEDIRQSVKERFDELIQSGDKSKGIEEAYDVKGRNADNLSDKEEKLEIQSADAQMASTYEEWEKAAPDISELEDVIGGRQELLENCESGKLNFLLANDYQAYALEYQNREEGDAGHILYFYAKSIYYAEQALRYEEYTEEDQRYIIKYISTRYKDIADCSRIKKLYSDNGWANNTMQISREILDYVTERGK